MLHKIQLFFLFSFLFISFLSAQDNETFAGMAVSYTHLTLPTIA